MKYDLITPMAACLITGFAGWLGELPGLMAALFISYCILSMEPDHDRKPD